MCGVRNTEKGDTDGDCALLCSQAIYEMDSAGLAHTQVISDQKKGSINIITKIQKIVHNED